MVRGNRHLGKLTSDMNNFVIPLIVTQNILKVSQFKFVLYLSKKTSVAPVSIIFYNRLIIYSFRYSIVQLLESLYKNSIIIMKTKFYVLKTVLLDLLTFHDLLNEYRKEL